MGFIPIVIRGSIEPLTVELYHPQAKPGVDVPIARCTVPCRAVVPYGRYKLYVHETEGTVAGGKLVDVTHPVTWTVSPKSSTQRVVGVVLGVVGPAMLLSGLVVALSDICYGCEDDGNDTLAGFLVIGGAVATPVGWTLFGNSFKPGITESAAQYGLAPTVFRGRGTGSSESVPGFVFTGRF